MPEKEVVLGRPNRSRFSSNLDKRIETANEDELRRMNIEEEIERIRRMAAEKQHVKLGRVYIEGETRTRFDSPNVSDGDEENINYGFKHEFSSDEDDIELNNQVMIHEAVIRRGREN